MPNYKHNISSLKLLKNDRPNGINTTILQAVATTLLNKNQYNFFFQFLAFNHAGVLTPWYISHYAIEQQIELLQESFINTQFYDDVSK